MNTVRNVLGVTAIVCGSMAVVAVILSSTLLGRRFGFAASACDLGVVAILAALLWLAIPPRGKK